MVYLSSLVWSQVRSLLHTQALGSFMRCLFVRLVFSVLIIFITTVIKMPERNTIWKEGLVLAHSSGGVSLLHLERHGGDSPSHQDKLGSRKQAWSGGGGYWPLFPCPLSHFNRPVPPVHPAHDTVPLIAKLGLPTQSILWECLHRQVSFSLLVI